MKTFTLTMRAVMEAGVVAGLAWWGVRAGDGPATSTLLGVAAPAVGFGIWGAIDFHRAGPLAEPLRLIEELAISTLAAGAFVLAGQPVLGWSLAGLSVGYHATVYATGQRLLSSDRVPQTAAGSTS